MIPLTVIGFFRRAMKSFLPIQAKWGQTTMNFKFWIVLKIVCLTMGWRREWFYELHAFGQELTPYTLLFYFFVQVFCDFEFS